MHRYDAFVCVDFRVPHAPDTPFVPAEVSTFAARDRVFPGVTDFINEYGERGALLTFSPPPESTSRGSHLRSRAPLNAEDEQIVILARVGVSLISSAQACENAESEIPDFDFERVREDARKEWVELLGRFEIDAQEEQREDAVLFYSSVGALSAT